MTEPRYTREEWEAIEWQELQESRSRARELGYGSVTIPFEAPALRQMSLGSRDALIDAKLAQAKASILRMIEEQERG